MVWWTIGGALNNFLVLFLSSILSFFSYFFCNHVFIFRAVSVQDGMVVLDWKFDDVNGTYNTTHFEVGFLFSFSDNVDDHDSYDDDDNDDDYEDDDDDDDIWQNTVSLLTSFC